MPATAFESREEQTSRQIHGLLVSYQDDGINACVHAALKGKKRVYYKCMDVVSNFLAFGTSVGAIYLFRLASVTHSTCKLVLVVPCDQGPIEVIRFIPPSQPQTDCLHVAIGTGRGSIVIFRLSFNESQTISAQEIYRAENFTKSESLGIKFIEPDQDLLEPCQAFTKLYICDHKCRIFVLDSNSIYPALPLLCNNKPMPVLDVLDSDIHQIFVHRSQLLLSTDERTQVFKEYNTRPDPIGKTQRKRGFYGACFFNVNYKPTRLQHSQASTNRVSASQQTIYSSTGSLADLENLIIFVARPKFSLWQVNYKRDVLFTHKFEPSIKLTAPSKIVPLNNEPLRDNAGGDDNQEELGKDLDESPELIIECFGHQSSVSGTAAAAATRQPLRSDHFERLIPIFSSTLGNLLLSHTRHEIFIIDPMSARLVIWHAYEKPIQQICCNENEIFVLFEVGKRNFQVERIVLLAPTQFVLELHRLNRRHSLMAFVELFSNQFRSIMALPLSGPNTITTEGGLLRNILWSTWREFNERYQRRQQQQQQLDTNGTVAGAYATFKGIVDEIIDESMQLRQSIENLADSRLFFTASNDNIERLCTEPYASMVSLEISIVNLHTNHVVHFSQEAISRQQSLAKLSQSIMNLSRLKRTMSARLSLADLVKEESSKGNQEIDKLRSEEENLAPPTSDNMCTQINPDAKFDDKKVFVEPLRTRKSHRNHDDSVKARQLNSITTKSSTTLNKIKEANLVAELEPRDNVIKSNQVTAERPSGVETTEKPDAEQQVPKADADEDPFKCPGCKWPRPRAHLKPMHHSQHIQLGWLQENLMPNFEENIDHIESRAFRHGLWHLVLKCLAFKNRLDEYINCCIMLDDVRLLNMERFVNIKCSEEEFINLVFKKLEHKLDFFDEINNRKLLLSSSGEGGDSDIYQRGLSDVCLRCKHVAKTIGGETTGDNNDHHQLDEEEISSHHKMCDDDGDDDSENDDISFNLVNLFRKIMLRRSADVRRAVETLLRHPRLLDRSKIPTSFYLEALRNQCSALRRTGLKV